MVLLSTRCKVFALNVFTLLSLRCLCLSASSHDDLEDSLVSRIIKVGWKNVSLGTTDDEPRINSSLLKRASQRGIQMRFVKAFQTVGENERVVWVISSSGLLTASMVKRLAFKRPFTTFIMSDDVDATRAALSRAESPVGVYLSVARTSEVVWRAFTFAGDEKVVIEPLSELFNLQGVNIRAYVINDDPMLSLKEGVRTVTQADRKCESDCQAAGFGYDVFKALSTMFNFSYTLEMVPGGRGGWAPVNGTLGYSNATFGPGFFKEALEGNVDIIPMEFVSTLERSFHVDISYSFLPVRLQCFLSLKDLQVDFSLYSRPLTKTALILTVLVVIFALLISEESFIVDKLVLTKMFGYRVLLLSIGFFNLLIMAFYEGALTMFLASEPTLPFSSLMEGLTLYPKWSPIVSSDIMLDLLEHYSPKNAENFAERKSEIVLGFKESVEKMESGRFFRFSSREYMALYLSDKPEHHITAFGRPEIYFQGMLVPKNSPFLKVINHGIIRLYNNGLLDRILAHHFYADFPIKGQPSKTVLTLKHTGLLFIIYGIGIILVIVFVVCEIMKGKCCRMNEMTA